MILNKKGLAVLPLAALLFTSCNSWKNISYDDAKNFIKENYGKSDPTKPSKKITMDFKGKGNNDDAKQLVRTIASMFYIELDDNLSYHNVDETPYPQPVLTVESFELTFAEVKDDVTFSTKGKEFKASGELKRTLDDKTATVKQEQVFNGEGYTTDNKASCKYKDTGIEFSFNFSQKIEY